MVKIYCRWCGKECKLERAVGDTYYVRSCPVCMDLEGKASHYNVYDPDNNVSGTYKGLSLIDTTIGAKE